MQANKATWAAETAPPTPPQPASSCWPRLSARAEFLRVQRHGRRFRGQFVSLLVAPTPPGAFANGRLGLTVSRKVGNAVVRNRVRRVLREAWRLGPARPLAGQDHVLIAFPQAEALGLHQAQQELACLLAKAHKWACSRGPASSSLPPTG